MEIRLHSSYDFQALPSRKPLNVNTIEMDHGCATATACVRSPNMPMENERSFVRTHRSRSIIDSSGAELGTSWEYQHPFPMPTVPLFERLTYNSPKIASKHKISDTARILSAPVTTSWHRHQTRAHGTEFKLFKTLYLVVQSTNGRSSLTRCAWPVALNFNDILSDIGFPGCQIPTCIRDILKFVSNLERKLTAAETNNQPASIAICASEDDLSPDAILLLGSYMLIKLNLSPPQVATRLDPVLLFLAAPSTSGPDSSHGWVDTLAGIWRAQCLGWLNDDLRVAKGSGGLGPTARPCDGLASTTIHSFPAKSSPPTAQPGLPTVAPSAPPHRHGRPLAGLLPAASAARTQPRSATRTRSAPAVCALSCG
eukprot:CAMPEP_0172197794 /NCGR_PEP_ID=MMETSP1050-20130122/27690_1 /TAXON_ID=233186 /ORGANISM="Cryptomonas curvata, Strain CCAP979/52" /LENGTH=368 /DNA_ID=CAMNT_0012874465 /DNA_START=71 /DNA_END=1174 /DNA_ORIENTATION=-